MYESPQVNKGKSQQALNWQEGCPCHPKHGTPSVVKGQSHLVICANSENCVGCCSWLSYNLLDGYFTR